MASQTLQINRLDIVATQGAHLVPRPHTPVFEKAYDEAFTAALDRAFNALGVEQLLRRTMYHEAADEWPMGHTPPEVKERRLAELRAMDDMMEGATSDEDSGGDEGDDTTTPDSKAYVDKARPVGERASRARLQEVHGLPTPPLSTHSPLPMPQEKKRKRDEEEKEYPRKTRAISAAKLDVPEGDKLDGSLVKGRKRRRIVDVDDEGEGDREHRIKARKTAAPRQQRRYPPKRPEAG